MNVTVIRNIGKVIRTLGLMGIMMALGGLMAANAPSASAGNEGKLTVVAVDELSGKAIAEATLLVTDGNGNAVAKGTADRTGSFSSYVAPGTYKVSVNAFSYIEYVTRVEIKTGQSSIVKAALSSPIVSPGTGDNTVNDMGKLTVYARSTTPSVTSPAATVVVKDVTGATVVKSMTERSGAYATYLAPGTYKVYVYADGYKEYVQVVEITTGQPSVVKAQLVK